MFEKTVESTKFDNETYTIRDITFALGVVDTFRRESTPAPLFLSMSFSKVVFGGIFSYPAIIVSWEDIETYLETYGVSFAQGMMSFTIAHELGHIDQWQKDPSRCKGKMETAMIAEVRADLYAIECSGIRKEIYHAYIKSLTDSLDRLNDNSKANWVVKKLLKLYNHNLLRRRTALVDELAYFGNNGHLRHNNDDTFRIGSHLIGRVLAANEGRWADD